jgi:hypothetical protein
VVPAPQATALEDAMARRQRNELALLPNPPLLIGESADEFDAMHEAIEAEIKPRGFIERMYVADISSLLWDILRLRRCKAVIINAAYRPALGHLLVQLLRQAGQPDFAVKDAAEELALRWFTDPSAKKQVAEILRQFDLDESAIEAEAIRRSSSDVELLDRMLTSLGSRRDKALRCIGEYRDGLARRLQESANRIIEAKGLPRLEDTSSKRSSAA